MKRNLKIVLYYLCMFLIMVTLIFLIELKSDYDVSHSYEKSSEEGYNKYVSVPKDLEVLGRGEKTNFFKVFASTITDELLMVLFFIISTIPLAIYFSAKYIEKLDDETNDLIDLSNKETYFEKEANKEKISKTHRLFFDNDDFNFKGGMFAGMLSDHLKMKDVFLSTKTERCNAIIFENDYEDMKYIAKILKGFSYQGESIVIVDRDNEIYDNTADLMSGFGYKIKKLDFAAKEFNLPFKKQKEISKINLLDYFQTESEVLSLASLIAKGNSHATKMLASLIFVTLNDSRIENPTISDVYDLAVTGLDNVTEKVNYIKSAYNVFNELILLDKATKGFILDEVCDDLAAYNNQTFNPMDDNKIDLNSLKQEAQIIYINLNDELITSGYANVIFEACYNVAKNAYIKNESSAHKKIYLINMNMVETMKFNHLADRLKMSPKYGVFFTLGVSNTKQIKDRYEYELDRILDFCSIKLFYAVRQYETTATFKQVLSNHTLTEIADIINSLDTNKCVICAAGIDYSILNIDEPTGEKYEKYQFSEIDNENVINAIKNKDVKLKVDYLEETKDRILSENENREKEEREKALNLKPELTSEEKEYIAKLLREKQESDEMKYAFAERKEVIPSDEEDELAYETENEEDIELVTTTSLNKLYDDNLMRKGYDREKEELEEKRQRISNSIKENFENRSSSLRTERDIEDSMDKLNETQNKMKKIIEEEKKKTTHALYEQMKNLR